MKNLLIALGAVTLIAGTNLYATDALLTPRAQGNQIKRVAVSTGMDLVNANAGRTVAPRAIGNETKTVAGTSTGSAATCNKMAGTPKTIAECASHPGATMPCCGGKAAK